MSKFQVGEIVTPKPYYIGSSKPYKVFSYDITTKKYKLAVPPFRHTGGTDPKVIQATWEEYELEYYKPSVRIKREEIDTSLTTVVSPSLSSVSINPDLLISKFPFENELCKIESEEINMKDILEIYKKRKREKLEKEHKAIKESIREEDEISQILKNTNKLIQETDPTRVFPELLTDIYSTKTLEKEKEVDKEYKQQLTELDELIEEVEGYFAMTTDFTERKAILRNYDIIDKKGKLII